MHEKPGTGPEPGRRTDDPVVITTRDIYTLAAETAGKVDSLLAMVTAEQAIDGDHETRIRKLESRFFGVVGTIGLAFATGVAIVLGRLLERSGG